MIYDELVEELAAATSIAKIDGAASFQSFEVVRSKDANADFTEQQTLKFYNDREKAKVGVYKVDRETGKYLAGAVFNLYAADDIYSVDGKLLFAAGELVAAAPKLAQTATPILTAIFLFAASITAAASARTPPPTTVITSSRNSAPLSAITSTRSRWKSLSPMMDKLLWCWITPVPTSLRKCG